jgi:hypothetical protein
LKPAAVLVLIASRHDAAAGALCRRAPAGTARVLSWRDLSTPGWRYYAHPEDGHDSVVIGGVPLATAAVSAVVTRCPSVPPYELGHIVPADRAYVAAEMTATLLAWLTRLRCPVANRPHAGCLSGPRWHPERWSAVATSLGLSALPLARRAVPGLLPSTPRPLAPPGFEHHAVTVVGDRAIEPADSSRVEPRPEIAHAALAVAHAVGTALLRVWFAVRGTEYWFLGADLDADLANASVADALLTHLALAALAGQP